MYIGGMGVDNGVEDLTSYEREECSGCDRSHSKPAIYSYNNGVLKTSKIQITNLRSI